jgi:hypothetical protein
MASVKVHEASKASGYWDFCALLLTTPVSIFLLNSAVNEARFSGGFFTFIEQNRPVVQFAIQIIANLLSIAQILVLCRLLNFAVRQRFAVQGLQANTMKLWISTMVPRMDWGLPWNYWLPLMFFMIFSATLRGLWAAALTPIALSMETEGAVLIPSWDNITYIKEYPSEIGAQGPALQNTRGSFSYSVGLQHLGSLLATGASATTTNGKRREHGKLDKSRYTYLGRSYGMGSTAGLVDDSITSDMLAVGYSYQEHGYSTEVECIYNETTDFMITLAHENGKLGADWLWNAKGRLPDSNDGPEHATYLGFGGTAIVAIGVAYFPDADAEELPPRNYMSFATGSSYDFLNTTQCKLDFIPTRFNISVSIRDQTITVVPAGVGDSKDINPGRRLTGTAMRQFTLIANDQTNIYMSMVGSAMNASITDLKTSLSAQNNTEDLDSSEIVLKAVGNSVQAMMDDMLGAYAAAQLVIGGFTQDTPGMIRRSAIGFGEFRFAISIFLINAAIIAAVFVEGIRTRRWTGLPAFDMTDVRQILAATSRGGCGLGDLSGGKKPGEIGRLLIRYETDAEGRYAIVGGSREEDEKTPIMAESMQSFASRNSQRRSSFTEGAWI